MTRWVIAAVAALTVLGGSVVGAYPPGAAIVTVVPAVTDPDSPVTVSVIGCEPGETVTFTFDDQTEDALCAEGEAEGVGVAEVQLSSAFGGPGTVVGSASGQLGDFEIVVVQVLPPTTAPPPQTLPKTCLVRADQTLGVTTLCPSSSVVPPRPAPGSSFVVEVEEYCNVGGVVGVRFLGVTKTQTVDASLTSSFSFRAPSEPGAYPAAILCNGNVEREFYIQVLGPRVFVNLGDESLPEGGTDATRTIGTLAFGATVIGLGLLAVARARRRQDELADAGAS